MITLEDDIGGAVRGSNDALRRRFFPCETNSGEGASLECEEEVVFDVGVVFPSICLSENRAVEKSWPLLAEVNSSFLAGLRGSLKSSRAVWPLEGLLLGDKPDRQPSSLRRRRLVGLKKAMLGLNGRFDVDLA